jgi:hypothetical protein
MSQAQVIIIENAIASLMSECKTLTANKITAIKGAMMQAHELSALVDPGAMRNVLRSIAQGSTGTNAPECMGFVVAMGRPLWADFDSVIPADFAQHANQKAIMRTLEAFAFIGASDAREQKKYFDSVTGGIIAGLILGARETVTFESLRYTLGQTIVNPDTLPGVSRHRMVSILTRVGGQTKMSKGTVSSKVSRTVGKHGLLGAMGITEKTRGDAFKINPEGLQHPFIVAYAKCMSALSDSDLGLIEE